MLYSHILPSHATWGYRGSPTVPTKKAFFLDKTLPKATIVAPTTGLRILQAQRGTQRRTHTSSHPVASHHSE